MKNTLRLLFMVMVLPCSLLAQVGSAPSLSHFLPAGVDYDPEIPTPAEVLGRELGSWHLTAPEIELYLRQLAEASERIEFEEIGFTHEGRRLYVLFVSDRENLERREEIRQNHLRLTVPAQSLQVNIPEEPVVVWQGYTIHGNEPSGSHAAVVYAYHLAAARDDLTRTWLKRAMIIIDPCMNPDGLQRFSTWVNSHQSYEVVSDPASREFHEAWPGGRTNHYWFDLNRDWLPAQHPESRARLQLFHAWKPNVLTDHHEMGSNSTYFFQPGVPSRNNPLTPANTFALTEKLASFHAAALDSIGSTYFTGERFDDFYIGKGSTYPDINGSVGILFEQASSRGHIQETSNGLLDFAFTIRNQINTSFSTLRGAVALGNDLLEHQRNFFREALELGEKAAFRGWYVPEEGQSVRSRAFVNVLLRHAIRVEEAGTTQSGGGGWYIPLAQPQYRLIQAIFEQRKDFQDSIFYDVSAWTLPRAFGLKYRQVEKGEKLRTRPVLTAIFAGNGALTGPVSSVGYLLDWSQYHAPAAVLAMLEKGIRCKAALRPFTDGAGKAHAAGTIFVPVRNQPFDAEALHSYLKQIASRFSTHLVSLPSGMTSEGISLGSNDMRNLELPRVAVLVGDGVNPYEAGEIWHLFDRRFEFPVTLLTAGEISDDDLSRYNTLILADGSYGALASGPLQHFLQRGGLVIGQKRALFTLSQVSGNMLQVSYAGNNPGDTDFRSYEERERLRGAQVVGGAIFEVDLDLSHPLCFGFQSSRQYVFRNSTLILRPNGGVARYPVRYTDEPLWGGYASRKNQASIALSACAAAFPVGKGRVVALVDNPNFRAFWLGTERFMANAVLFGRLVD